MIKLGNIFGIGFGFVSGTASATHFGRSAYLAGIVLSLGVLVAPSLFAQDVDAMAKWTSATIIHYRAVGEFSGTAQILTGTSTAHYWNAQATDRIELEYDWNQAEYALVGQPAIKNFPTTLVEIESRESCPAPRIEDTTFELATALAAKESETLRYSGLFVVEANREQPGGSMPARGTDVDNYCGAIWVEIPSKSEKVDVPGFMGAPQAMMLAMPGGGGFEITPDGKSLITRSSDGWVWTYTPTAVK